MGRAGPVVGRLGNGRCHWPVRLDLLRRSYLQPMGMVVRCGAARVAFALTFLPALLAVLGPRIHAGRLPLPRSQTRAGSGEGWPCASCDDPCCARATLAILLGMGVPFLHLRLGAADVHVLDESVEARRGYEQLRRDFPEQAALRTLVAGALSKLARAQRAARRRDFRPVQAHRRLPHVRKVESLVDGDDT